MSQSLFIVSFVLEISNATDLVLNNLVRQESLGSKSVILGISNERVVLTSSCPLDVCVRVTKSESGCVNTFYEAEVELLTESLHHPI